MQKILIILILCLSFAFIPASQQKKQLSHLYLGYKDVMSCDCLFAQNNDMYWDKVLIFAHDSSGKYIFAHFEGDKEHTRIPVSKSMSEKRKKGQAWQESYKKDNILIILKGSPIEHRIMRTYSYDVEFSRIDGTDTTKQTIIGHCQY